MGTVANSKGADIVNNLGSLPLLQDELTPLVQDLVNGISEKFVPIPSNDDRTNDII